jgi:integrase
VPRRPQFGRIFKRKWKNPAGIAVELPIWWIEYYQSGVQRRESSKSEKYSDAEALLKRRQAEITTGTAPCISVDKVKVASLLDMLLADYELNQKSLGWAKYVDAHLRPVFGGLKARSVGTSTITRYVAQRREKGAANSTINRELSLLRRAFYLGLNAQPPLVAAVPRIPKLVENNIRKGFFDHQHFILLRAELPEHLRPVITFAYSTGCRKSEILSMLWSQIDLAARVVRLEPGETKNDEGRTIPLIGELFDMLVLAKEQRDQRHPACPYVFSRYGKKISNFYSAWEEASKRAGLVNESGKANRLFHDLRRTGVRNLIRAGVPERVAMMISGHKTRSVMDRYNIVDERDLLMAGERLERYLKFQSEASKDKYKDKSGFEGSETVSIQGGEIGPKLLN